MFERNIQIKNGRYEVGVPRENKVDLANNEEVATMQQLTYGHIMHQYLWDRHEEKLIDTAKNSGSDLVYYLPHRVVIRDEMTTMKIKIVFVA